MQDIDKKLDVTGYRQGDEHEINELYNQLIPAGKMRSIEEWAWKYIKNPFSRSISLSDCITVARSNGKIVAQYAYMPIDVIYEGNIVSAGHPVENFIRKNYRMSFQTQLYMYRRALDERDEKFEFGFGFPGEIAYAVGKRFLKYKDITKLEVLFKRLNLRLSVLRRLPVTHSLEMFTQRSSAMLFDVLFRLKKLLVRIKRNVKVYEIKEVNGKLGSFLETAKYFYRLMPYRSKDFVSWRFLQHPSGNYKVYVAEIDGKIVGYAATKIYERKDLPNAPVIGYIMDMLCPDNPEIVNALLDMAVEEFIRHKVDYSLALFVKEDYLYQHYINHSFRRGIWPEKIPMVYEITSEKAKIGERDLINEHNWHICYCDLDNY